MLTVNFVLPNKEIAQVEGIVGLSLLEIARKNDIPIEGACEGALACSTCHVIIEEKWFKLLPQASNAEEDMLDLAFGVTVNSRLGCQVIFEKKLDGMVVPNPSMHKKRNVLIGFAFCKLFSL